VKPLGLLVAFAGYTLAWFGWASLKGPGVGIVDILVPGREVTVWGGGSSSSSTSTPGVPLPKGTLPPRGPVAPPKPKPKPSVALPAGTLPALGPVGP